MATDADAAVQRETFQIWSSSSSSQPEVKWLGKPIRKDESISLSTVLTQDSFSKVQCSLDVSYVECMQAAYPEGQYICIRAAVLDSRRKKFWHAWWIFILPSDI